MHITLALLHSETGKGSIPPTHASRRLADKVNKAMSYPTLSIKENICGLGQPRIAPVVTLEAQVWGLDHVMNPACSRIKPRVRCTKRWRS